SHPVRLPSRERVDLAATRRRIDRVRHDDTLAVEIKPLEDMRKMAHPDPLEQRVVRHVRELPEGPAEDRAGARHDSVFPFVAEPAAPRFLARFARCLPGCGAFGPFGGALCSCGGV